MRKKAQVTNRLKAKVALDALRNEYPLSEIARRNKVHPIQVGKWRKKLQNEAYVVFEDGGTSGTEEYEKELKALYEEIGRQKVEIDFLKKKSTEIG